MCSRTKRMVLAAALFAGGCDGEEGSADVDPIRPPKLATDTEKAPLEEPVDETIRLDNGFVPDPHVAEGSVVGTVDAATTAEECSGWITTEPSHVLEALGTFAELRVLAHADDDATLMVETPAGERWCSDDAEDAPPIVVKPFPAGTYRIWVGAPEPEVEMPYVLGISELPTVNAASLAH